MNYFSCLQWVGLVFKYEEIKCVLFNILYSLYCIFNQICFKHCAHLCNWELSHNSSALSASIQRNTYMGCFPHKHVILRIWSCCENMNMTLLCKEALRRCSPILFGLSYCELVPEDVCTDDPLMIRPLLHVTSFCLFYHLHALYFYSLALGLSSGSLFWLLNNLQHLWLIDIPQIAH